VPGLAHKLQCRLRRQREVIMSRRFRSFILTGGALCLLAGPADAREGLRAVERPLQAGETVVRTGGLVQRLTGRRPRLVVTSANAVEALRAKVGKKISLRTVNDGPQDMPALIRRTTTRTTFRSPLAPGRELLDPPVLGGYSVIRHKQPVTLSEQISPAHQAGHKLLFKGTDGHFHVGYQRPDSLKIRGTLEDVTPGGDQLLIRLRGGKTVSLDLVQQGIKVLVDK
jgi:hypothetical protein